MKHCSQCGAEMQDGDRFCMNCGSSVSNLESGLTGQTIIAANTGQKKSMDTKNKIVIGVLAALIVVGGIWLVWAKQSDVKATTTNNIVETLADTVKDKLEPNQSSSLYGNTSGNIVNFGLVAQQGDWIYYSSGDDGWNLYKSRTDGSKKTRLNKVETAFINVVGDWIYYRNDNDGFNLYKMRTDGSNNTKLNDDYIFYPNVVGDWIYYVNSLNHMICGPIYKTRTDGSNRTKLNDDKAAFVTVAGDWIYYVNYGDKFKIYKCRTDGSNRSKLSDDGAIYMNVVGDWIYYQNNNDSNKLYKMDISGNNRTKLNDDRTLSLNVDGTWIYFTNISDRSINKIRTDGSSKTKLSGTNESGGGLGIASGWVYYLLNAYNQKPPNLSDYPIYKIRTDGTERQVAD